MNIGTNASTYIIVKHNKKVPTVLFLGQQPHTGHSLDETKHLFNTGQIKHIHTKKKGNSSCKTEP